MSARLNALATRYRLPLLLAGSGVAALLSVRLLFLPVMSRIQERRGLLQALHVKMADGQLLAEQLPAQQSALEEERRRFDVLESRVGRGQSLARVMEVLRQEAQRHRLVFTAVQPRTEEQEATLTLTPELSLREVPVTLQLQGRYRQIGEFLGGLSKAPYLLSLRKLTVTKSNPQSVTLKAEMALVVYLAETAGSS